MLLLFSGDSRLLPTSWKREEVRVQGSNSDPSDSNQCLVKDTRAGRSLADCIKKKKCPSTVRQGSGFPGKQALVLLSSPAEGNW